MSSNMIL